MSRKITFGRAVSLDGHFAGPGESIDWLLWSDEAAAASAASWKGVDPMLMGRRTFEFAMREGGELGSALIEAGLVDEIGLNVHPVLLGG